MLLLAGVVAGVIGDRQRDGNESEAESGPPFLPVAGKREGSRDDVKRGCGL